VIMIRERVIIASARALRQPVCQREEMTLARGRQAKQSSAS
jgi:hypothetical protein